MFEFVLVVLALGLTVSGFALRNKALVAASSAAWVIFGLYCRTASLAVWDVYYGLFFLSLGIGIAMIFSAVLLGRGKTDDTDLLMGEDKYDRVGNRYDRVSRKASRVNQVFSPKEVKESRRLNEYNKTGGE